MHIDEIMELQTGLLREKTVEDRLNISASLRSSAWELKRAVLRHERPEWSESELEDGVRLAFGGPR